MATEVGLVKPELSSDHLLSDALDCVHLMATKKKPMELNLQSCYNSIRQEIEDHKLKVRHISGAMNIADILTKHSSKTTETLKVYYQGLRNGRLVVS